MVAEFLPHRLFSAWASAKWAGGASTRSRFCSRRTEVSSEAGGATRDDEASAPCAEHPDITQPSSLITSTPHRGLGGWCGQAPSLAPSRRRDVVVRDLHHCHLAVADWGRRRQNRWRSDRHGHDRRRDRRHLLRLRSCSHAAGGGCSLPPPYSLSPAVPSMSAASWGRTRPT
jgi:hypothetical protein